jgi:hypothetical protein
MYNLQSMYLYIKLKNNRILDNKQHDSLDVVWIM